MKKVLALFLAIMMLFSAVSISTSALDISVEMVDIVKGEQNISDNQIILVFDLNGGTIKNGARVYKPIEYKDGVKVPGTGAFEWDENYIENTYYMFPESANDHIPEVSAAVRLPAVNPPSGYIFNGWYCVEVNKTYPGNTSLKLKQEHLTSDSLLHFVAAYSPEAPEEDEMEGVFNILVKVFGTIIGLLFLSGEGTTAVESGMQLMSDLLGNLFA